MTNENYVRHVSASELAGSVATVLHEVQSGATIVVTRRGQPVAVMHPPAEEPPAPAGLQTAEERASYSSLDVADRSKKPVPAMLRLVGTPSMRAVLAVFLQDPAAVLHQRAVARRAAVGLRSAQISLGRLEDLGLISSERDGNRRYYRAIRTDRFEELRSMMARELGVAEVIARHLAGLANSIEWAFIYGSVASGTDKVGSDVDLLVVGDVSDDELVGPVAEAQRELGRQIDVVNYRPVNFRQRRADGNHFITSVLTQARIDVLGGPDDT